MNKLKAISAGVLAAVMVGGIATSTVFSVLAYKESKKHPEASNSSAVAEAIDYDKLTAEISNSVVDKLIHFEGYGEQYDEDGNILIAGEYPIKDYKYIADAYTSGDTSALSDKDKEVVDALKDILAEIWSDDMTLYEKELAAHDWLAKNAVFDGGSLSAVPTASEDAASPYGAIVKKKCVCVGYATTFQLFMYLADAPECLVVHDTDYGHSWDLVKLDDGEYYFVDVYMDANNGTFSHESFNINSETFAESHDWDTDAYPTANGTKYNYLVANSEELETVYDLPQYIFDTLKSTKKDAVTEISFSIKDKDTQFGALTVIEWLESSIGYNNYELIGSDEYYFSYNYSLVDSKPYYYCAVFRSDLMDTPDFDIGDEDDNTDYEKLYEILDDVFGDYVQEFDWGDDDDWGFSNIFPVG